MEQKLKEQFPQWCSSNKDYATVLTNDIDSLLGCMIEQMVKGNKINYFYDFNSLFVMDKNVKKPLLGIDLANNGCCWDNHVTLINDNDRINPNSANLNTINRINKDNYFKKYAGSTALLMWSYYGLSLPKTDEGKIALLSIDSAFLGHYDSRFKRIHNNYFEQLGFTKLIDLLNRTSKNDYFNIQRKHKIKAPIKLDDSGILVTQLPLVELQGLFDVPIDLPKKQFTMSHKWQSKNGQLNSIGSKKDLEGKIISFALTGRNKFSYTYAK